MAIFFSNFYLYSSMYAIVDIETTGGHAAGNDITEIAILVHDGQSVIEKFETLVRPKAPIPQYIQVLTGITHEMVAKAPPFEQVADTVATLLQGKVFIAHNVNFDYSFLKYHLENCGLELDAKKLCTVRLSRKVFPGLPSYSLGNLCRSLEIDLENRHRAGGDAEATAKLFDKILSSNGLKHIESSLKKGSREQCLPLHLDPEQVRSLPYGPGVYYFHDEKGKVIYVGKARNIKYRVTSHFTNNGAGRQRQEFIRKVHNISFQECGTELMAFIFENIEIRRLWPLYNTSQKHVLQQYAIYSFPDQNGYIRLVIDKQRKHLVPLYTFNLLSEGQTILRNLIKTFRLCRKLCFLSTETCSDEISDCSGACIGTEPVNEYNNRVENGIEYLKNLLPSFAVVDKCFSKEQHGCILVEKGRFYGMGYVPSEQPITSIDEMKTFLTAYPENDYIRGLIYQYVSRKPDRKIVFETS